MQHNTVNVGDVVRGFTMVALADGTAITAGTVNYYLKALTGDNAGKWWKNSDQTWDVAETANAMTHVSKGHWAITLAATPFISSVLFMEYAQESGDLNVPDGRLLKGFPAPDAAGGLPISDAGGLDLDAMAVEATVAAVQVVTDKLGSMIEVVP